MGPLRGRGVWGPPGGPVLVPGAFPLGLMGRGRGRKAVVARAVALVARGPAQGPQVMRRQRVFREGGGPCALRGPDLNSSSSSSRVGAGIKEQLGPGTPG